LTDVSDFWKVYRVVQFVVVAGKRQFTVQAGAIADDDHFAKRPLERVRPFSRRERRHRDFSLIRGSHRQERNVVALAGGWRSQFDCQRADGTEFH